MTEILAPAATMHSAPSDLRNPVADHMGYILRRASSMMMAELGAALAQIGLRPVESTIVMLVAANPGCTQSDIGRMLGIKRANMVPLIAGLIAKGLVEKARVDGRTHALSLTEEGVTGNARIAAVTAAHEARFAALLGDRDSETVTAGLRRIVDSGPAGEG